MTKNWFNMHNKLISWNLLEDALDATMMFTCPKCKSKVCIRLRDYGDGVRFSSDDIKIQKHVERLEKKYFAVARSIRVQCRYGHAIDAVFVFGETQPARFVLAQVASVKPKSSLKEKILVLATFTLIMMFILGLTTRSYFWYTNQKELERIGSVYPAEILSKDASTVPKTPLSYHVSYRYYIGDLSYDGRSQVDEKSYLAIANSTSVEILIDPSDVHRTAIKGNEIPYATFRFSVLVDVVMGLGLLFASIYTQLQKYK
jgi:hypothetical protein